MKRDSGLCDLAQRLHLWPGDMAMELQRDALTAFNLLEKYTQQALLTEINYVTNSNTDYPKEQIDEITIARNEALRDLNLLEVDLKEQILKHHLYFGEAEMDIQDAFEAMGTKLFGMLNSSVQRDYEGESEVA